jgi:hypothetical protein
MLSQRDPVEKVIVLEARPGAGGRYESGEE